jgi:hypothetical protein
VTTELKFPPPFGAIEPAKDQEGNDGKLLALFLKPEVDWRSSSSPAKVTTNKPPLRTLLHPLPLEDPLGEFPSLRRIRRVKPCQKWCPVARAMPGSGEMPPLAAPPPHWPRLSRPCLDQWLRLDHRYPFILIKSEPQIEESTTESDSLCRGPMSQDRGPGPWDCGPISWDFQ